ncbi:MAG: hypothetical protein ACRD68_07970, partial [Pyrinomonadaceae bacterium]
MSTLRVRPFALVCALSLGGVLANPSDVLSFQQAGAAPVASSAARALEDVDLEVQLQLLIATNAEGAGAKLPAHLDATVKQLRSTLQLANYRMGATFLHRVRNGRGLDVKGTGSVLPVTPAANNPYTPSFYNFVMSPVELKIDGAGQE